jgi:hypothetical protein
MNYLPQILDSLPPPYTQANDSVLASIVNLAALELEVFQEDLDSMRQTHWIQTANRLEDATKLGALFDVAPLPWESIDLYRQRLLSLVVARLHGALGPNEIRQFTYDYLQNCERVLGATFVPGLQSVTVNQAFDKLDARPRFRPLDLKENPPRARSSRMLAERNGRVPYLLRWSETNQGLDDTVVEFQVAGLLQNRTVVPVLVNLTTGDLVGYAGRISFGKTLQVMHTNPDSPQNDRQLQATLDGFDVTDRMFSFGNFRLGVPFAMQQHESKPLLPRLVRGANDWIFLSVGLYDMRGLDRFFFSIAGQELHEAVFDETSFDNSLFPSGTIAQLALQWVETEPACFELHVPRYIVIEPANNAEPSDRPFRQVADSLVASVAGLRAAGVKAEVVFVPFTESQSQRVIARVPWQVLDAETAPSGITKSVELGARFGESPLDQARFE